MKTYIEEITEKFNGSSGDKITLYEAAKFTSDMVLAERERIKVSLKTLLRAAWWLGADNHDNPQSGFENWYEREQPIKKLIDSL